MASSTRSAFSTDFAVMISLGVIGPPRERHRAARARSPRPRAGGRRAPPGSPRCPAAPCPAPRRGRPSCSRCPSPRRCRRWSRDCPRPPRSPSSSISPARYFAQNRRQSVQAPSRSPCQAIGHHRPGDELHRRQIRGSRAHQLRRHGLVAAADQHDRVHRLRADHLLDVHGHQVAEHQAGRTRGTPRPARSSGNSSGSPPAASTPRFTASTSSGMVRWQLLKPLPVCRDADDRPRRSISASSPSSGRRSGAGRARSRGRRSW